MAVGAEWPLGFVGRNETVSHGLTGKRFAADFRGSEAATDFHERKSATDIHGLNTEVADVGWLEENQKTIELKIGVCHGQNRQHDAAARDASA